MAKHSAIQSELQPPGEWGAAGGDLDGYYPNPTVAGIQGHPVNAAVPANGDVLMWNAADGYWFPKSISSGAFTAGGDLSGNTESQTVIGLNGHPVSNTSPSANEVLKWNGTQWVATALPSSLPPNGTAGGDLSRSYPNPTVANVHGTSISATASANQVLVAANSSSAVWSQITDGYIASNANISGSKINANFGSQAVSTSGNISSTGETISAANGLVSNSLDRSSSGVLTIGETTANVVNIGKSGSMTTVLGNMTVDGYLNVDETQTINGSTTFTNPIVFNAGISVIDGYSIQVTGFGTGAVHSDSSGNFTSSLVVDDDISGSAAISGSKINPNFGSQNISTTSSVSATTLSVSGITLNGSGSGVIHSSSGVLSSSSIVAADLASNISLSTSGNISTTGSGTITSAGLLTGNNGLTISSGTITFTPLNTVGILINNASGVLSHSLITDGYVSSSAAIQGTKITPTFNANITTSGNISATGNSSIVYSNYIDSYTGTTLTIGSSSTGITIVPPVTMSNIGLAGVMSFSTGLISSALIVNANISGTITGSKIAGATTSSTGVIQLAGDLSGTSTSPTVAKIQGVVISGSPTSGQVLTATNSTAATWKAAPSNTFTAGGDLTGSATSQTVSKLNGASTASGSGLTTGNSLYASGSSALSYGAVNLAGGSGYVTGNLPLANIANGTSGYILQTNGSTTQWNNVTGDFTANNSGKFTLGAIDGYSLPAPSGSGTVLTYNSGALSWAAPPTASAPYYNPLQVATLRWYQANQTSKTVATGVATKPCFDGTYLWVPCYGGTIYKILPSSGAVIGTYTCSTNAFSSCYDGNYIWTVGQTSINGVYKINPITGATVATYSIGTSPADVCFDGTNIWIADQGGSNIFKVNPSTGTSTTISSSAGRPYGICFDGTNIWWGSYNNGTVTKYNVGTSTLVGSYTAGSGTYRICFDGTNIWTANDTASAPVSLSKILASTGAKVGDYNGGSSPGGLAFDGTCIWATPYSGGSGGVGAIKINASTGATVGSYNLSPTALQDACFDGTNMWIACDSGPTCVVKM